MKELANTILAPFVAFFAIVTTVGGVLLTALVTIVSGIASMLMPIAIVCGIVFGILYFSGYIDSEPKPKEKTVNQYIEKKLQD